MNNNSDPHFFKKSLGQNFLKNKASINDLLDTLEVSEGDEVFEIGPGRGAVTEELIKRTNKVTLFEKDENLIDYLTLKFPQAEILHTDFLEVDLPKITKGERYKVVGSLPYNVSKKIIYILLTSQTPPEKMSFIIQKEVAKDYSVKPPKASLLSNFANLYSNVKLGKVIPAKYFYPVPKVDGQVITFSNISPKYTSHRELWSVIRMGFSSPRKILASNLKSLGKDLILETIEQLGISKTARAGELTLENWIDISKTLSEK